MRHRAQCNQDQHFRTVISSSYFECSGGTRASLSSHFERSGSTGAGPSGHFERSGGTGQARAAISSALVTPGQARAAVYSSFLEFSSAQQPRSSGSSGIPGSSDLRCEGSGDEREHLYIYIENSQPTTKAAVML